VNYKVYEVRESDRKIVAGIIKAEWGSPVVVKNRILYPDRLQGFIARDSNDPDVVAGLVTYNIEDDQCEIVTMNSFRPNMGIGTQFIKKVKETAVSLMCSRIWLITTNDNIDAIRFYQMKGFRIAAIYPGAIEKSRLMKPSIPDTGCYGIPIRDEIEMEMPV